MTQYRQILRLHSQGISLRSIAQNYGCSHNTVGTHTEHPGRCGAATPQRLSLLFFMTNRIVPKTKQAVCWLACILRRRTAADVFVRGRSPAQNAIRRIIIPEYSRPLGDTVSQARIQLKLTPNKIADLIVVDSHTVPNIENYKGYPQMEVLYPLVRTLRIDIRDIFLLRCLGILRFASTQNFG